MLGRFEGKEIKIDLEVTSLLHQSIKSAIPAKLDTGFSGDLQLTYDIALPLALNLTGFQTYTLANGAEATFFECLGLVSFNGKTVSCSIDVKPKGSILIGVNLLKKLEQDLKIDFVNEIVELNIVPTSQPPTAPTSAPTTTLIASDKKNRSKT